jgi:hypothetical protein
MEAGKYYEQYDLQLKVLSVKIFQCKNIPAAIPVHATDLTFLFELRIILVNVL